MICFMIIMYVCFFFKQKTAYEMRISDWSSDVCSSDLAGAILAPMLQNAIWKRLGYRKKDVICWDCVRSRAKQRLGRPLRDQDWQTCRATLLLGAYWHFPRDEVPPHLRPWFEAASLR